MDDPEVGLTHLTEFERSLVATALAGGEFGQARLPDDMAADDPAVRAEVLRSLILGQYGRLPRARLGVRGLLIEGSVDLSLITWRGRIDLTFCRIRGDLNLDYSELAGSIDLTSSVLESLQMDYARIRGRFRFTDGVCSRGLHGLALEIDGSMVLRRAHFTAPEDVANSSAVNLYRAKIGDLYLDGATARGGIYAHGLTVQRNVRLREVVSTSREELGWTTGPDSQSGAVGLAGSQIGAALYISWRDDTRPHWQVKGKVNLTRVQCATLRTSMADLDQASSLSVDALTYGRLVGVTADDWLCMLRRRQTSQAQPYLELARYAESIGRLDWSRRARIECQRRQTAQLPRWSRERVSRTLWQYAVAYGYRPARGLVWLLVCVALTCLLLRWDGGFLAHDLEAGTASRGIHSWGQALSVGCDSILPFAGLGVSSHWSSDPAGWWQDVALLVYLALHLIGWSAAAIGIASVTGLVKADS